MARSEFEKKLQRKNSQKAILGTPDYLAPVSDGTLQGV
jgi:hypothetical protein